MPNHHDGVQPVFARRKGWSGYSMTYVQIVTKRAPLHILLGTTLPPALPTFLPSSCPLPCLLSSPHLAPLLCRSSRKAAASAAPLDGSVPLPSSSTRTRESSVQSFATCDISSISTAKLDDPADGCPRVFVAKLIAMTSCARQDKAILTRSLLSVRWSDQGAASLGQHDTSGWFPTSSGEHSCC